MCERVKVMIRKRFDPQGGLLMPGDRQDGARIRSAQLEEMQYDAISGIE
jgi:hypothetical protein